MVLCCVDIGGIVDHRCLRFLFIFFLLCKHNVEHNIYVCMHAIVVETAADNSTVMQVGIYIQIVIAPYAIDRGAFI